MIITSLSTKGQMVIPKNLREKMVLHEGDSLVLFELNGLLVCKKLNEELNENEKKNVERILREIKEKNNLSHVTNHRDYIR